MSRFVDDDDEEVQQDHKQEPSEGQEKNDRDDEEAVATSDEDEYIGWDEAMDSRTGRTYYYHTGTGEVTWQKPEGYVKPYHTSDDEDADVDPEPAPAPAPAPVVPVVKDVAQEPNGKHETDSEQDRPRRPSGLGSLFGSSKGALHNRNVVSW